MAMRYYAPFPGGGGDPARPRAPHALRVGDAERDAVAADLGEHYAAGRLTLDELHQRLDAVFAAKTAGQLTRIMADLPGSARLASRLHGPYPTGSGLPGAGRPSRELRESPTPSDRAGRVAAMSLLLLAMLIWLFTALLFARHGIYHPPTPVGPPGPFPGYPAGG
jgi:hypothetical protein